MVSGGSTPGGPIAEPAQADAGVDVAALMSPAELRVADALLRCVARWGMAKTTVEDVAKEAGISRATVYRLFPSGKDAIVRASIQAQVARLVAVISDELAATSNLEDCLVAALVESTRFITENHAFSYLRAHEPESVEAYLAFDRLDGIFGLAGSLVSGSLGRFLPDDEAYEVGVWCARLVVSYLILPSDDVDLAAPDSARAVVRTYLLPALIDQQAINPTHPRPDPVVNDGPTESNPEEP